MQYLDPVKNFCQVEIESGHDVADLSVDLFPGQGAKLPDPVAEGNFNLVWWNVTDYPSPADDPNVEIVRVTAKTGDSLTITRAQEGTVAKTHNKAGKRYFFALVVTAKMIKDIDDRLAAITAPQRRIMIAPTGAINGTNKVFATLEGYSNLQIYVNGLAQSSADYSETTATTFTMTIAPIPGDVIHVTYDMV